MYAQVAEAIDILPVLAKNDKHQKDAKFNLKTIVPGEIWLIENFFSPEQCEDLIKASEEIGYTTALINTGVNSRNEFICLN